MTNAVLKFDDNDLLGENAGREPLAYKEHEDFCQAVVATGNPSEAYRRHVAQSSATKPESVWTESSRLMQRPEVTSRIRVLKQEAARYAHITPGRVMAEIGKMAFFDIRSTLDEHGNLIPIHKLSDEAAAGIAGIEMTVDDIDTVYSDVDNPDGTGTKLQAEHTRVTRTAKIKLADKAKALDQLTKILGMNIDKTEITGANGTPLIPETNDTETARRVAFLLSQGLTEAENG